MDIQKIEHCTLFSLKGEMTFPEVIKNLEEGGVERYVADLVGRKKFTYGRKGEFHMEDLKMEAVEISKIFQEKGIQTALQNIQQGRIPYLIFLQSIGESGCCHYEVFIDGQKVIYFGRDGSFHIERFPSLP